MVPPNVGLFLLLVLSIIILVIFFGMLKSFWNSFMPPQLCLDTFDHCGFSFMPPQCCLGTFIVEDFFMPPRVVWALLVIKDFFFGTCPPVQGVILAKVIFSRKSYQAQKGTTRDFQHCERMIKDDLSSFQLHAVRIDKLCFLTCEYAKWFLIIHAVKTQL